MNCSMRPPSLIWIVKVVDVESSILVSKCWHRDLRMGAVVLVGMVGIAPPTRTLCVGVWVALWWGIEIAHGVGVLTGGWTIVALNGCVPLHTTGFTYSIDPN